MEVPCKIVFQCGDRDRNLMCKLKKLVKSVLPIEIEIQKWSTNEYEEQSSSKTVAKKVKLAEVVEVDALNLGPGDSSMERVWL